MKIAVITMTLTARSGGARLALEVAQQFRAIGHDVAVYTFRLASDRCFPDLLEGLRVVTPPPGFSMKEMKSYKVIPGFSAIISAVNRHRIARTLAALVDADTELLNPHSAVACGLVAYYFRRRVKSVPCVWHMNSLPFLIFWGGEEENIAKPHGLKRWLFRVIDVLDRRFLRRAVDAISVLDHGTESLARRHFPHSRVAVNRTGIDARRFSFRARTPPVGRPVRLLCHSSFMPARRFENAIHVLATLCGWGYECHLVISGECALNRTYRAYRDKLIALADILGMRERVTFPGSISDQELVEEFSTSDIFIHPHYPQTWGMAVFEAMATGLPAVVSRSAGAHEVLKDGEQALLVDPRNLLAIAQAVKVVIENPDLYLKLSKNGAEFVRKELTWARHVEKILQLIGQSRVS